MNSIFKVANLYIKKLNKVAQDFDPSQFDEEKFNRQRDLAKGVEESRLTQQLKNLSSSASNLFTAANMSANKYITKNDIYDDMEEDSAIKQFDTESSDPESIYDHPTKSLNHAVGNSLIEQGVVRDSKKVDSTCKYLVQLFDADKLTKVILKNTLQLLQSAVSSIKKKAESIGDEAIIVDHAQRTLTAIALVEVDNLDPFYPDEVGGYSIDLKKSI